VSDPQADALRESQTYENLREAFAADAQAAARYSYFAKRADEEGRLDLEELFSALARGKLTHAHSGLAFLRDAVDPQTREPIRTEFAIDGGIECLRIGSGDCSDLPVGRRRAVNRAEPGRG